MSTNRILSAASQPSIKQTSSLYLPLLDMENTLQFISDTLQKPIDDHLQQNIKQALATHPSLAGLNTMISSFNKLLADYGAFPGLTNTQRIELQELLSKRKFYKELEKDEELDIESCKALVKVSKKLLPLDQMLIWSTSNHEALLKESLWQDLAKAVKDPEKKKSLEKIQQEWFLHEGFYAYTSEDLLEFYTQYILVLENKLSEEIKSWHRYSNYIKQYLAFIHVQLLKIKEVARHSMLHRLKCAELTKDIQCDDLILLTRNRIEQECGMVVHGHGKNPAPRRSLTIPTILEFNTILDNYCKEKHTDPALIAMFDSLNMRSAPKQDNQYLVTPTEAQHPVYLFFVSTFPELLKSAPNATQLAEDILTKDAMQNSQFILNRLKDLLNYAIEDASQATSKPGNRRPSVPDVVILQAKSNLHSLVADVKAIIENSLQQKFDSLLNDAFNLSGLDFSKISCCIADVKILKNYCQLYDNNKFSHAGDMIIAIAKYIKNIIAKNGIVTSIQCNNIGKIMQLMYPELNPTQVETLKQFLNKMPDICTRARNISEPTLLHLLSAFLESALLDNTKSSDALADAFKTALARHNYIANFYQEPWDNTFKLNQPIDILESYGTNIVLKLIKPCPYLNLDNLDMNYANHLFAKIESLLPDEPQQKLIHQNKLKELKINAENILFSKFNDRFMLAQHLMIENSHKINLDKLKNLLATNTRVFVNPKNNADFLNSIMQTCRESLKTYFTFSITNHIEPDCDYIKEINRLFNQNLFTELCNDPELIKLMQTYVQNYDGSNTTLSRVLTELILPSDIGQNEKLLCAYAKKRIDYIKSTLEINEDDYHFFYQFSHIAGIENLIANARSHFYLVLESASENESKWLADEAKIIELFGDTKTLNQYRLKRLLELSTENDTISPEKAKERYDQFALTINPNRLINKRIVDIHSTLPDGEKLSDFINRLITNKKWTYLLEKIIKHTGNHQQLQQWHTHLLIEQLEKNINFSNSWIGNILFKRNTELLNTINAQATANAKQFLQDFFGEENLSMICKHIDNALLRLLSASNMLAQKSLYIDERDELLNAIACIKPLFGLHRQFGSQPESKEIFLTLDKIERKIKLHYELGFEIGLHTQILDQSTGNMVLNNVTAGLIKAINHIESINVLANDNILAYLTFIDREIFYKLDKLLNANIEIFEFNTLATVANFIHRILSENFIHLLHQNAKSELGSNMYWYKLINHFDDSTALAELEKEITDIRKHPVLSKQNIFTDHFDQTLAIAKRLSRCKDNVYSLLNKNLLAESGISVPATPTLILSQCIASSNIEHKNVLKLWSACAEKLQTPTLNNTAQTPYVDFLVGNLTTVSDEILNRSLAKESLLEKFVSNIKSHMNSIISAVTHLFSKPSAYVHRSLWKDTPTHEKLIEPLNHIKIKTNVTHAITMLNNYLNKKLPSNSISSFNQFCNDPLFASESNVTAIHFFNPKKSILGKSKLHNLELIYLMQINKKLLDIFHQKEKITTFSTFINSISNKAALHTELSKADDFLRLLKELRLQLAVAQNDSVLKASQPLHGWHPTLKRMTTLE